MWAALGAAVAGALTSMSEHAGANVDYLLVLDSNWARQVIVTPLESVVLTGWRHDVNSLDDLDITKSGVVEGSRLIDSCREEVFKFEMVNKRQVPVTAEMCDYEVIRWGEPYSVTMTGGYFEERAWPRVARECPPEGQVSGSDVGCLRVSEDRKEQLTIVFSRRTKAHAHKSLYSSIDYIFPEARSRWTFDQVGEPGTKWVTHNMHEIPGLFSDVDTSAWHNTLEPYMGTTSRRAIALEERKQELLLPAGGRSSGEASASRIGDSDDGYESRKVRSREL